MPASGGDRRLVIPRRHAGPVVPVEGEVRQVRLSEQPDRCQTELERSESGDRLARERRYAGG